MGQFEMTKKWSVMIPMAGHLYVEVEADSEEDAIEKASEVATLDNLESWDTLERFNQGNVCYCPQPWQIEANELDED